MSPGYGLRLITAPTWTPVQVADMEAHARILTGDPNVGVIQSFITTAQDYVEAATKRKIAQQQWLLTVDEFPGRQVDDYRPPTWRYGIFRLPFPPLVSIDQVQYVDPGVTGGQPFALTTLDSSMWMYDANTEPGRLAPSPFNVWPATNPLAFQAVQVTFTCGYLTPPVMSAPTTATTGGTLAANTYYYVITSTGVNGETSASNELSITTTGATSKNTVSWGTIKGVTGYNIYRGTSAGNENVQYSVAAGVTSFVDTGAAGTAATPPTTNANVPPGIIQAIKLLAAHFYEHREESIEAAVSRIPLGVRALISANTTHEYD